MISVRSKNQVILINSVHIGITVWIVYRAFNSLHFLIINLKFTESNQTQILMQFWEKNSSEKLLFILIKIRLTLCISEIKWINLLEQLERSDLLKIINFTIDCKTCPEKKKKIFLLISPLKFILENTFMESKSLNYKMELKIYLFWLENTIFDQI